MNPPKITPGPWRTCHGGLYVISGETRACEWIQAITDTGFLDVAVSTDGIPRKEIPYERDAPHVSANSRAIAALPECLAALAGMLRAYEIWRESGYLGDLAFDSHAARAALLKAGYTE